MARYAKLRTDLVSTSTTAAGETVWTIKDPIIGKYFRLRDPEYWLVHQLDGRTSPEEVAARFREKFNLNITAENVEQFIQALDQLFFLESGRSEQAISRAAQKAEKKSWASRMFFWKMASFSPGRFLERLTRLYRPLHNAPSFAIQLIVIALGLGLFVANAGAFRVDPYIVFRAESIVAIIIAFSIIFSLHEFAHAVVCRYYGGEVREIGFLLMYLQPCFYADLSDAWLFEKKRHRLAVTFAGLYFQLVLMAVAMIVWRVTVPGNIINDVAELIVLVTLVTYLFNFNPLIKLDGYYMLSDWLEVSNLRSKSFGYLGNVFKRVILGWPIERVEVTPREKKIFITYAVFALLYTTFLVGFIFLKIAAWLKAEFGPPGLLLLFALVLFIFRRSLSNGVRGIGRHFAYMKGIHRHPIRLSIYVLILAAVVVVGFFVPFPDRVSGDVVVEPIADFRLALNEFGLLESVVRRGGEQPELRSSFMQMTSTEMAVLNLLPVVEDGQPVKAGDTVALLQSNQITRDISSARAELERLESQLELLRAPPKPEEVEEARAEVNAAKANLQQLERELTRIKSLVAKDLETQEKLEAAESAVDIARAELENKQSSLRLLVAPPRAEEEAVLEHQIEKQRSHLQFLQEQVDAQSITAPISGTVIARADAQEVLQINKHDTVELKVPVSDFDLSRVDEGLTVKVKVRSYPTRIFTGTVVRVPEQAEGHQSAGYFPVSVVIDNDGQALRAGMTGYAKIEVGKKSLAGLAARKVTSLLRVEFWSWW